MTTGEEVRTTITDAAPIPRQRRQCRDAARFRAAGVIYCRWHGCPLCYLDDGYGGDCDRCTRLAAALYRAEWPETVVDPTTGHDGEDCTHCTVCDACRGSAAVCSECGRCAAHAADCWQCGGGA
ncbi:MAG: hypothetical protein ACRDP8_20210 [Actinopolymorphaceae bacterium]